MGFSRKWLTALGIEADKVDEIVQAHVEVVNGITKERDDLKNKVSDLETEITNLTNNDKDVFDKLKKEFDDYKAGVENEKTKQAKQQAYTDLLRSTGVSDKRIGAILKVTDIDGLELDEKGKIKNEKDQIEHIKNEWSDFIERKSVQGASTATPPQNTGGNVAKTKEEILKIKDTTERQKAWAEYLKNGDNT